MASNVSYGICVPYKECAPLAALHARHMRCRRQAQAYENRAAAEKENKRGAGAIAKFEDADFRFAEKRRIITGGDVMEM